MYTFLKVGIFINNVVGLCLMCFVHLILFYHTECFAFVYTVSVNYCCCLLYVYAVYFGYELKNWVRDLLYFRYLWCFRWIGNRNLSQSDRCKLLTFCICLYIYYHHGLCYVYNFL